jgi:hypothetical protein
LLKDPQIYNTIVVNGSPSDETTNRIELGVAAGYSIINNPSLLIG